MRVRHGRITFLFPLIGFLLLFGASTALGEVRPGSPLPLAYRGSTPVDALKLNPAALDEIRYQILFDCLGIELSLNLLGN